MHSEHNVSERVIPREARAARQSGKVKVDILTKPTPIKRAPSTPASLCYNMQRSCIEDKPTHCVMKCEKWAYLAVASRSDDLGHQSIDTIEESQTQCSETKKNQEILINQQTSSVGRAHKRRLFLVYLVVEAFPDLSDNCSQVATLDNRVESWQKGSNERGLSVIQERERKERERDLLS
jgi:hypothetical protein